MAIQLGPGPQNPLPTDPLFLHWIAQQRWDLSLGDPEAEDSPATKEFNGCVVDFYKEAVARFYWRRLMKILEAGGISTFTTGQSDYYSSLMFLNQVNKSTISHWNNFTELISTVRPSGSPWRRGGTRYHPMLSGFTVPLAALGLSPERLGVSDGWVVNRYAIVEMIVRVRNEILGAHRDYPLATVKDCYRLSSGEFRDLYDMVDAGSWAILPGPNPDESRPSQKKLLDLWLIPFGLVCSASSSLGEYILGFSDDAS